MHAWQRSRAGGAMLPSLETPHTPSLPRGGGLLFIAATNASRALVTSATSLAPASPSGLPPRSRSLSAEYILAAGRPAHVAATVPGPELVVGRERAVSPPPPTPRRGPPRAVFGGPPRTREPPPPPPLRPARADGGGGNAAAVKDCASLAAASAAAAASAQGAPSAVPPPAPPSAPERSRNFTGW
jgi:hypothetical protein